MEITLTRIGSRKFLERRLPLLLIKIEVPPPICNSVQAEVL
jgi:hypothetical protein